MAEIQINKKIHDNYGANIVVSNPELLVDKSTDEFPFTRAEKNKLNYLDTGSTQTILSYINNKIETDYQFKPMMYRNLEKDFSLWVSTPPSGSTIPQETPILLVSTGTDDNGTYVIIKNMPYVYDVIEHPERWGVVNLTTMITNNDYGQQQYPMLCSKIQYLWDYNGDTNVAKIWCDTTEPANLPSEYAHFNLQAGNKMMIMSFMTYGLNIHKDVIDFRNYTGDMKWVGLNALWKRSDGKYCGLVGFSYWSQPSSSQTVFHLYTADNLFGPWVDQTPMNGYTDVFSNVISNTAGITSMYFNNIYPLPNESGKFWTIAYGYTNNQHDYVRMYTLIFDEYLTKITLTPTNIPSPYTMTTIVNTYSSVFYWREKYMFLVNIGDEEPNGGITYILQSDTPNGPFTYHSTVFDFAKIDTMGQCNHNTGRYSPLIYNDELYVFTENSTTSPLTGNPQLEVFLYKYNKHTNVWSYFTGPVFVAAHGGDLAWSRTFGTGWDWIKSHMGAPGNMFFENNKLYFTFGGLAVTDGYQATMAYIDLTEVSEPEKKLNKKTTIEISDFANRNTIGKNIWIGGGGTNSKYGTDTSVPSESGSYNTSLGIDSFKNITTGNRNTGIGYGAGIHITNGSWNSLFGNMAGGNITTGNSNVCVGNDSLVQNDNGTQNIAIGHSVGNSGGGDFYYNTLIGFEVGENDSYPYIGNTAVGHRAGFNLRGNYNVMLGYAAGKYESGSNSLYIDAIDRGNTPGDKAGALLYGTFNSTPANQTINGSTTISNSLTTTNYKLSSLNTAPSTSGATGTVGDIKFTNDAIYVCVNTNVWKKANLITF